MAGMNVLGNVVESPGKKGKETSVPYSPLLDEPAMHVFIGEDGSGHDEALRTLVENVLGNGHKVIALDTRGAITPFIVPFLPGGHLKKVRGMKEKVSGDIVALVRPVVVFFNSVVEENPGTICKVTFPLVHLLLAACTLDQDGTRPVDVEIIPSFADHVKDALLAIIWVAFGKDFDKYKDKATLLVGYLHEVLKAVAAARAEPSWKVLKEALLGHPPPGFPDVGATTSLAASEMQSFIFTLDYYISNSLIFNDRGPALSKVNPDTIYHANLLLFYLQDLSDRERVLVATLLGLQQALERHQGALPLGGMITQFSSDGISPAASPVSLALDELSLAFPSDPAIPLVHRALQGMLFSGITRGGSLFLGTGRPKELSDTAIDTKIETKRKF